MFEGDPPNNPLRKVTQEDMLASGVRVALAAAGPVGAIVGEFLTQLVPAQRLDRLQDFVGRLGERVNGMEEEFRQRLSASPAYAVLTEEVSIAAVRTASDECRGDLAALLVHGLSKTDAEVLEEQALLRLRERITDAQVVLLMSYGNFRRTFGDPELQAFWDQHPGLFGIHPPSMNSAQDEIRRWTMKQHYEAELEALGLLRDTEGIAKSGPERRYEITTLGRLLLEAIGRSDDPNRA